jgi:hypothetical protein
MASYDDMFAQVVNVFRSQGQVLATSSKDHRSSVSPDLLARRWGTSLDVAAKTLKVKMQQGI